MKAVVYSAHIFEKEFLAKANNLKKHDITLISNPLNMETAAYAEGKDAVIVFPNDDVSSSVIDELARYGIKYISTRSTNTDHIDINAATRYGIKIAYVPLSPESTAEHILTLALALNRKLITAVKRAKNFDFRLDGLTGFNLRGKTIGLIGFDETGKATARIFTAIGCNVIAFDPSFKKDCPNAITVSLKEIYEQADIISLHPSTLSNKGTYIINRESLSKIKPGTMLINTSRGELLDTSAVLEALKSGQLGYLGADVYENESGLYFDNHLDNPHRDPILQELMQHPNVIITPHQAFLTKENLQEMAVQTIRNLDNWQAGKCAQTCSCPNDCATEP